MSAIAFNRLIGPVPLDVVVSEGHQSSIGITSNPIETGAKVNDHAYIEPNKLTLDVADGNAVATWQALKALQRSRVPFTIVTGFDVYTNMLIKELNADRDKVFSSTLRSRIELQEVIIVDTAYTTADGDDLSNKQKQPGQSKNTSGAKAKDATTKDRVSGTVGRGDNPTTTAPTDNTPVGQSNKSILSGVFGG